MAGIREDWFPTSIWYFDVEEVETLNAELLAYILLEQARDPVGMSGRSTVLGWHSQDKLHHSPELQKFTKLILENANEVATFLKWDLSRHKIIILNCWAIANETFAYNRLHNHFNSFLSGVYYVKAPENCGDLFFRDPREAALMTSPPVIQRTHWSFEEVTYTPIAGRMLIFPSWLLHGVTQNITDDVKISISFNIGLKH